jgi:hypothetical protein
MKIRPVEPSCFMRMDRYNGANIRFLQFLRTRLKIDKLHNFCVITMGYTILNAKIFKSHWNV